MHLGSESLVQIASAIEEDLKVGMLDATKDKSSATRGVVLDTLQAAVTVPLRLIRTRRPAPVARALRWMRKISSNENRLRAEILSASLRG